MSLCNSITKIIEVLQKLRKMLFLVKTCTSNADCQGFVQSCNPITRICECDERYTFDANGECQPNVGVTGKIDQSPC